MAGVEPCEPRCLYNILNQQRRLPRLAERGYLCLLDTRTQREYDESHIITARRIKQSPTGEYLVPDSEELRSVRYCVVYDCESSSLDCCDYEEEKTEKDAEGGNAARCARSLEQFTRHPVLVLMGGYKRFSACYHFLRTQKILWMPQELDNFQPYPVEILPAKLYMGNFKQACSQQIQKDLKIKAHVNISEQPATLQQTMLEILVHTGKNPAGFIQVVIKTKFTEEGKYLHIPVPDSLEADLFSFFATICDFIDAQVDHGAVLLFSSLGISRSSTVTMAYLMHSCQFSLKRAWDYVLKCKANMRPHRGFVKQLSSWETQIFGAATTDISEPNY